MIDASTRVLEWWRPAMAPTATATPSRRPHAATDEGYGRASFRGLLAFLAVLMLSPQTVFPFLQPLRLAFLSAGFAVLAYLMQRLASREPLIESTPAVKYVALIVAWAVLTVPMSYWPGGSVAFLLDLYFKTVVVFLLLAHVVDSERRLRSIAWAMTLFAIPLAFTGVSNYLGGDFAGGNGRILGYQAPLTTNPNDLALTLNLILPLAIGLFLDSGRVLVKCVLLVAISLSVAGVIVTFSRSGFLTLAVVMAIYGWKLVWRGRTSLVAVVLVLGIGAAPFVPGHYWHRLATITDIEEDRSGSAQERWSDAVVAAQYAATHPLVGAGVGQGALAMNEERGARWLNVHNVYLQYAVELGVPGLVLFLLLFRASLRSALLAQRIAAYARASALFHLSEAVRVSLLAFVVAAMFHPAAYQFWFYLLAGLALAAQSITTRTLLEPAA